MRKFKVTQLTPVFQLLDLNQAGGRLMYCLWLIGIRVGTVANTQT